MCNDEIQGVSTCGTAVLYVQCSCNLADKCDGLFNILWMNTFWLGFRWRQNGDIGTEKCIMMRSSCCDLWYTHIIMKPSSFFLVPHKIKISLNWLYPTQVRAGRVVAQINVKWQLTHFSNDLLWAQWVYFVRPRSFFPSPQLLTKIRYSYVLYATSIQMLHDNIMRTFLIKLVCCLFLFRSSFLQLNHSTLITCCCL